MILILATLLGEPCFATLSFQGQEWTLMLCMNLYIYRYHLFLWREFDQEGIWFFFFSDNVYFYYSDFFVLNDF